MPIVRKLCLRGGALYLCIPRPVAAALEWTGDSHLAIEMIGKGVARVRPVELPDLEGAKLPPITSGVPREVAK